MSFRLAASQIKTSYILKSNNPIFPLSYSCAQWIIRSYGVMRTWIVLKLEGKLDSASGNTNRTGETLLALDGNGQLAEHKGRVYWINSTWFRGKDFPVRPETIIIEASLVVYCLVYSIQRSI